MVVENSNNAIGGRVSKKFSGCVNVIYFIDVLQSCVIKTVGVLEWLSCCEVRGINHL